MWSFFKQKKLSYNFSKGPILNVARTQSVGGNVIQGTAYWRNISLENCLLRELRFGELSAGKLSIREMSLGN